MAAYGMKQEQLTVKQEQLITLLVSGIAVCHAAKVAKVGERTAHRWLQQSHFQTAYKAAQSRLFEQAMSSLLLHVDGAIACLSKHLSDAETPPAVQVRCAQLVLEQLKDHFESEELERRLTLLEDTLKDTVR